MIIYITKEAWAFVKRAVKTLSMKMNNLLGFTSGRKLFVDILITAGAILVSPAMAVALTAPILVEATDTNVGKVFIVASTVAIAELLSIFAPHLLYVLAATQVGSWTTRIANKAKGYISEENKCVESAIVAYLAQ